MRRRRVEGGSGEIVRFQNQDATREASDLYGGEGGSVALRRE